MVPGREAVGPVSVADGGPFSGKSIIYTYVSSSSSSGRTMNSFGAVGDHLQSARTGSLSSGRLSVLLEDQPDKSAEKYSGAHPKGQSPLADLMVDSIPDQDPYKLLIVGETGPCRQHTAPYFISPSEFPLLPSRRRSLSDLVENQKGVVPSKTGDEDSSCPESQMIAVPASLPQQENNESRLECPAEPPGFEGGKAPESRETQMFAASTKVHPEEMSNFGLDGPAEPQDFERGADVLGPPAVPVWHRAGPPFQPVRRQETKRAVLTTPINVDFDPATFQLPLGVSSLHA